MNVTTIPDSSTVESLDFNPELLCDLPGGCVVNPPQPARWRCVAIPCGCVRLLCSFCVLPLFMPEESSAMTDGTCELCGARHQPMTLREFFRIEPIR
jgi:hypothetical protein